MTHRSGRALNIFVYVAMLVGIFVADQALKVFMRSYLADGASHSFIPGVMDLRLVYNEGAAFGLGAGASWLFIVIALVILVATFVFVCVYRPGPALSLLAGAVAGGGLGNMLDRLMSGTVTDFFACTFIHFPVFNLADIAIVVGVVWAFVLLWISLGKNDLPEDKEVSAS